MSPAPWNNDPLPSHLQSEPTLYDNFENHSEKEERGLVVVPKRAHPVIHPSVDAPICIECQALELTFFDPTCTGCKGELQSSSSDIAHVFAALRQWVPQVQQNIELLADEALRRGAHPDDRDCLTDMTLLMYASKSGANGVGDVDAAARVAQRLIELGADLSLRCKWTNMTALHYASFFDAGPVMEHLLMKSKGADVDSISAEYENGTALHIAAASLGISAAQVLLKFGADKSLQDNLARTPLDCIPDVEDFCVIPNAEELIDKMKKILQENVLGESNANPEKNVKKSQEVVSGRTALKALNLKVGDRVIVNSAHIGTLKFCGTTGFAPGIWAGVALDEPNGKNNGSVKGVVYFNCNQNHGVFVQAKKISKVGRNYREETKPVLSRANVVDHGKVNTKHVTSRLNDRLNLIEEKSEIRVGDRVKVLHFVTTNEETIHLGFVRFIGEVDFADDDGRWFGIELDEPIGRHDGTVQGVRYFAAALNTGIFVTEAKLTKLLDKPNQICNSKMYENGGRKSVDVTKEQFRRTLPTKHKSVLQDQVSSDSHLKSSSPVPSSVGMRSQSRTSNHTIDSHQDQTCRTKEDGWKTVSAMQFNKFQKKVAQKYLEPGTSVICIQTKEMAVVKYVGRIDFATGIWVGLELREAKGNHDGVVKGKRYFSCKAKHGLLTTPRKISVHGITGDKLLKPEAEYPF